MSLDRRALGAVAAAALAATIVLASAACQRMVRAQSVNTIEALLGQSFDSAGIVPAEEEREIRAAVRRFYAWREYRPAWVAGAKPESRARALVDALRAADEEGLHAADYRPAALERQIAAVEAGEADPVELDLALTVAFVSYGFDLLRGRMDPEELGVPWYTTPRRVDLAWVLERAIDGDDVAGELRSLAPPYPEYAALRTALSTYRAFAARGGWPRLPESRVLTPGDRVAAEQLRLLAQRLAAEGYLDERAVPPAESSGAVVYADTLVQAVKRFQETHGIEPDGKVGPVTTGELNVTAAERVRQIELNMERWRWLPDDLGQVHIRVNVPGFVLRVFEGERQVTEMRVVVGKEGWGTPVFSDRMTYLEINPVWNVPTSILREEVLVKARKDPSYLSRNKFVAIVGDEEVDPGEVDWHAVLEGRSSTRMRQDPGPSNALGRIKFMFPNQYSIYLHDTPANHLFERTARAYSHGCIRIERPLDLALYLLRDDPRWTETSLREAVDSGERQQVTLPRPVPVHLLYWTVVADGEEVSFRPDIYEVDAVMARAAAGAARAVAGAARSARSAAPSAAPSAASSAGSSAASLRNRSSEPGS